MIETSLVQTSLSTVMMAILTTNAFMILMTLCLVNEKFLVRVGHRLLAFFVAFTSLRFVLPIELPFTITLKLPMVLSQVITKCHDRLFLLNGQSISLWQIFKNIWLVGFIVGMIAHIITYYYSSRHIVLYGKELTNTDPYQKILTRICQNKNKKNCFRIIELPGLDVPALFGILHPRILIPSNFKVTEKQLTYILRHEATHHFNHDILLKNIIKIITLAYWWDIFSWLLRRQTDVILEMRIDDSLTMADASITQEYMQCLINISERASGKKLLPGNLTIGILPSGYKDLKRRFQLMMNNQNKTKNRWTIHLLGIGLILYFSSYAIVLEAYLPPSEFVPQDLATFEEYAPSDLFFPSSDNSYFIANEDGTYDYYINGNCLETVDSLDYYSDNIPVYTKNAVPQQ